MDYITVYTEVNYEDKKCEMIKGEDKKKELIPMSNVKKVLSEKLLGFYLTQPEIKVIEKGIEYTLEREDYKDFINDIDEVDLIGCVYAHQYKDSNLTYNFRIYFQE